MTLDEIRIKIDEIDSQMKLLFLERMGCAGQVAQVKAQTGGEVFVLEREQEIIRNRASDVEEDIYAEYTAFLRHLMSVSRRYQYGILKDMQNEVLAKALTQAGLDENQEHHQIELAFVCSKNESSLNLYIDMVKLNGIAIDSMKLESKDGKQTVTMVLDGNVKEQNMRRLLCQIGKEAQGFTVLGLE